MFRHKDILTGIPVQKDTQETNEKTDQPGREPSRQLDRKKGRHADRQTRACVQERKQGDSKSDRQVAIIGK